MSLIQIRKAREIIRRVEEPESGYKVIAKMQKARDSIGDSNKVHASR